MLTLIEKIQQNRLSKTDADTYTIVYEVEHQNGTKEEVTSSIYATNQLDADELGKRIQLRHQAELNQGETKMERWGFGYRDVMSHKTGFLLPWKDPIYKRSFSNGVRLPMLRSKAILKNLYTLSAKKEVYIDLKKLTKQEIRDIKKKNILRYFSSATMFVVSLYSLVNSLSAQGLAKWPFILSAIGTLFLGAVYLFQAIYTNRKMESIVKASDE